MKMLPPSFSLRPSIVWLAVFALGMPTLYAQQRNQSGSPRIGYIYPAGLQQGTSSSEIIIGGQFLQGAQDMLVSGSGVKISVVKYNKPIAMKRANELRDYLQEARKKIMSGEKPAQGLRGFDTPEIISKLLKEAGATDDEIKGFLDMRAQRNDPKRQQNLQISETVTIKVEVAPDAQPGPRAVRVLAANGASNPLSFCISKLPEQHVSGILGKTVDTAARVPLPSVINGQILPGQIDHFSFMARKGARVVIAVQARDLIPYLADAVPGWFQPVAVVYDAKGREVAYANDFRFSPDPVLNCEIPETGLYILEIKDALYRGREDFIYRVTIGEIPFVTGIFPLGGKVGVPATVDVWGWNLPNKRAVIKPASTEGIHPVPSLANGFAIGDVAFASDTLPEITEKEPNNERSAAQQIKLPIIINGRIDTPGDVDVFAFSCKTGEKVVADVLARRLNSPLDSWLKVTDETGLQIAFNDDSDDKAAGLQTHQADSHLTFTAPSSGQYYISIGNTQHAGGPEYGYRLRIGAPQPDYALRVVPSAINARAGAVVPVTLYALRKDGFAGDINVALKDAPKDLTMQGGGIPAGQDSVRATLIFPQRFDATSVNLSMEGQAKIDGREITHPVVPADDLLQAFIYHHLVPADELIAVKSTSAPGNGRAGMSFVNLDTIKLPVNGVAHLLIPTQGQISSQQGEVKLELSNPPDGVTIDKITPTPEGISILFRADSKVKAGLRGNLIVEIFLERAVTLPGGKKTEKRRFPIGFLPAIPFKVAER